MATKINNTNNYNSCASSLIRNKKHKSLNLSDVQTILTEEKSFLDKQIGTEPGNHNL